MNAKVLLPLCAAAALLAACGHKEPPASDTATAPAETPPPADYSATPPPADPNATPPPADGTMPPPADASAPPPADGTTPPPPGQ